MLLKKMWQTDLDGGDAGTIGSEVSGGELIALVKKGSIRGGRKSSTLNPWTIGPCLPKAFDKLNVNKQPHEAIPKEVRSLKFNRCDMICFIWRERTHADFSRTTLGSEAR
jgi:hypothetical protein